MSAETFVTVCHVASIVCVSIAAVILVGTLISVAIRGIRK